MKDTKSQNKEKSFKSSVPLWMPISRRSTPEIYDALEVSYKLADSGSDAKLVLRQHLGDNRVRTVACPHRGWFVAWKS